MSNAPCLEFFNPAIQCTNRVWKEGRCSKHQLPAFYKNMKTERQGAGWKYIRDEAFRVWGTICWHCKQPGADSIHHLNGDSDSMDNLRPMHQNVAPYCHRTITAQQGHASQAAAKPLPFGERWNPNRDEGSSPR